MKSLYIGVLIFLNAAGILAQSTATYVSTSTTAIGVSAISVNTIVAKTFTFKYPFYNYVADSSSGLFLFSLRQKSDAGTQYSGRSLTGAITMARDSVNWLLESNVYDLALEGNSLLFSNDTKSARLNKLHGFDEIKYQRLLYTLPDVNKGFAYAANSEQLACVNLTDATTLWSDTLPNKENWVDAKPAGNLLLVGAAGLHAIDPGSGIQWSYPLSTSVKVTKALTYSLANNNPALRKISHVIKTSNDENSVTELASNILVDGDVVYMAGREKLIAVSTTGQLLWELDLRSYPVSKMLMTKSGASLVLVNFGLAKYTDNYVIYGKPFVLNIDAGNGKIKYEGDLGKIENLVDFSITSRSLMFASKNAIQEIKAGSDSVRTILTLDVPKYGSFAEFIDGDQYYTEKAGFYVSLNFINDNPVYFRADNNKIYSLDKQNLNYEYHLTDIFKLEKKMDAGLLIGNENQALLISPNYELLARFNTTDKGVVLGHKIFFVGEQQINAVDVREVK